MVKNYLQQVMEEEEKLFRKVRNHIMDNFDRKLTIDEVSKETGVDRKLISKWVTQGKLDTGRPDYRSKDNLMSELIKSRDEMVKELEKKK